MVRSAVRYPNDRCELPAYAATCTSVVVCVVSLSGGVQTCLLCVFIVLCIVHALTMKRTLCAADVDSSLSVDSNSPGKLRRRLKMYARAVVCCSQLSHLCLLRAMSAHRYLRPKAFAVTLDETLIGRRTVLINIYQMLVVAAMKLHCHLCTLPQLPRPAMLICTLLLIGFSFITLATQQSFSVYESLIVLIALVRDAVGYMCALVRLRIRSAQRLVPTAANTVSADEIHWYCLSIRMRVLCVHVVVLGSVYCLLAAWQRSTVISRRAGALARAARSRYV